jgi:hypothetical protein
MFAKLDEMALRAEGFTEGVPIVLWDGQTWHFPRPVVLGGYPVPAAEGGFEFKQLFDLGLEYGRLMDAYIEKATYVNLLAMAWALLSRNYTLKPEDLAGLFFLPAADSADRPRADALFEEVFEVCAGRSPKPTPVGSI